MGGAKHVTSCFVRLYNNSWTLYANPEQEGIPLAELPNLSGAPTDGGSEMDAKSRPDSA